MDLTSILLVATDAVAPARFDFHRCCIIRHLARKEQPQIKHSKVSQLNFSLKKTPLRQLFPSLAEATNNPKLRSQGKSSEDDELSETRLIESES
jgi:hypothetical protein